MSAFGYYPKISSPVPTYRGKDGGWALGEGSGTGLGDLVGGGQSGFVRMIDGPEEDDDETIPDYYYTSRHSLAPSLAPQPSTSGTGFSSLKGRLKFTSPPSPDPQKSPEYDWEDPPSDKGKERDLHQRFPDVVPVMTFSDASYPPGHGRSGSMSVRKRRLIWTGAIAGVVLLLAVVIPVSYVVVHQRSTAAASTTKASSGGTVPGKTTTSVIPVPTFAVGFDPLNPLTQPNPASLTPSSGGDGSTVNTFVNGVATTFTYSNSFGGNWAVDPVNPYNVSGRAQSWSPSLQENWVWGTNIMRGVNLGGWLLLEPFINPSMFETYGGSIPGTPDGMNQTVGAVDEWTLSLMMRNNLGYGGFVTAMRLHYETFITEEDFAQIAGAGLNYVRIPIGFWAVSSFDSEPYLSQVSWEYFVRATQWARKYGLRILLDLHALPGSQNGWNHSGRAGVINWMYGVMGISNAQRTLNVLRSLTEYISQDGVKQVVPMLSLVNEAQASILGWNAMAAFYYQAYTMIRSITGTGAGNGPIILIHDGFQGIAALNGFLSGADRLGLDQHPYLAFATPNLNNWTTNAQAVCGWGGGTNDSQTGYGLTIGGEWSTAINDCGLWLDGVGGVPAFEKVGSCVPYDDWRTWTSDFKANVMTLALANMDALQNWMFWTWKIGNSTHLGYDSSPFWHYKRGLQQGWIPADPRIAGGYCKGIGVGGDQFAGTFPASATGGGNGAIATDQIASWSAFPPASMGPTPSFNAAQVVLFPTYTRTGAPVTLARATPAAGATKQNGWYNTADVIGDYVTVRGCPYFDYYNATAKALAPTTKCTPFVKRIFDSVIIAASEPTPPPAPRG